MTLLTTLIGGTGLVAAARRFPAQVERLERLGGLLLVAGFVGIGFSLARSVA